MARRNAVGRITAWAGLPDEALDRLDRLAHLLSTDPDAPTAVRDHNRVLLDHLADSLVALDLPEVREATALADLGSGAGLPGLPLAIALPRAGVSLVESSGRKCAFIDRAIAICELDNARAVPVRAEEWPDGAARFDVVTARALAPLNIVAEYAAPLLRVGGALIAWRGKRELEVEADAAAAAEILGMSVQKPIPVEPYPQVEHRFLHVMVKLTETPPRFPRRPGMARKRPLGTSSGRPSDRDRR